MLKRFSKFLLSYLSITFMFIISSNAMEQKKRPYPPKSGYKKTTSWRNPHTNKHLENHTPRPYNSYKKIKPFQGYSKIIYKLCNKSEKKILDTILPNILRNELEYLKFLDETNNDFFPEIYYIWYIRTLDSIHALLVNSYLRGEQTKQTTPLTQKLELTKRDTISAISEKKARIYQLSLTLSDWSPEEIYFYIICNPCFLDD